MRWPLSTTGGFSSECRAVPRLFGNSCGLLFGSNRRALPILPGDRRISASWGTAGWNQTTDLGPDLSAFGWLGADGFWVRVYYSLNYDPDHGHPPRQGVSCESANPVGPPTRSLAVRTA